MHDHKIFYLGSDPQIVIKIAHVSPVSLWYESALILKLDVDDTRFRHSLPPIKCVDELVTYSFFIILEVITS